MLTFNNKNRFNVMVGTSRETKGGISTVIESYIHSGFFSKYYVCYIASHCDGTFFDKLKCALDGLFKILNVLLTFRSNVFHFHVASRSSFWRKTIFIILAKLLNKKIIFQQIFNLFRNVFCFYSYILFFIAPNITG